MKNENDSDVWFQWDKTDYQSGEVTIITAGHFLSFSDDGRFCKGGNVSGKDNLRFAIF